MRTDFNLSVLVMILLFTGLTPSVQAGTPKIEPSRSSVEEVPAHGSFQSKSRFIGHYGETFSYSSVWVLHAAFLRDGIEVVRFHSPDIRPYPDSPPRVVKDSDFEKVENFAPLKLTQLLVIPHREPGFDLEALRAKKIEELRLQGATFEVQDAPMPVFYWPKNTFQVYVTAPYRLHQLYVESEGKLFILTGGLDEEKGSDHFFSVFFAGEFINSLGRYFERLHRVPFIPPPESFDVLGGYARLIFLPLLAAGLLLLGLPWKKQHTRPIAAAALSAAILGATLHAGGFYLARALSDAGRPGLIAPGVIGWILVPLILGAVYYRSRGMHRAWRWAARAFSVLAVLMLVDFGMDTQRRIASGQIPVATDFSIFMALVGVLCGACFGLSLDHSRMSAGRRMLALAFLLLVAHPTAAPAQDLQDELEAKITVGKRSHDGETYKALAEKELKDQGRYFEYQRVEITGIVAADDTNKFAPGIFDRVLHPSRNADGSDVEREGFIQSWKRWWRGPNNARKDINDLFDTKTGKLSPRAREILEPLMDKENVHVKEIVAHSWGAVLLNVAIREGLINPPEHIIVVGVPDSDLLKWALLAHNTGTKVDILSGNKDLALQAAEYADRLHNLDILGKQRDYNDGKAHEAWARWGKDKTNHKIGEDGKIHVMRSLLGRDMSNPLGHDRGKYYDELKRHSVMETYTADQLSQVQTRIIETRALELMEADIQREIRSIRKRRGIIDEDPPPSQPSGPGCNYIMAGGQQVCLATPPVPVELPQAIQPAAQPVFQAAKPVPPPPFSRAFPQLKEFAISACRAPEQVYLGLILLSYYDFSYRAYDDEQIGMLASDMGDCPRQLFYKLIERIRAGDWRQTQRQWVRNMVAAYSRPPENPAGNYTPPASGGNRGGGGSVSPPAPPPVTHDPEGEALEQLREIERRKRWGLRPVM